MLPAVGEDLRNGKLAEQLTHESEQEMEAVMARLTMAVENRR
jgi:hypothetical protein